VPERPTLARTDEAALTIERLTAFETGFTFAVVIRGQPSDDLWGERWDPFGDRHHQRRRRRASEGMDFDMLLFGIQFSDGSKATNLGNRHPEDDPPIPPVLFEGGGGGGDTQWHVNYWVWPLPPLGPVAFVCEWPGRGIPLSRVEIEAELIHNAAARAEILWPEEGEPGVASSSTFSVGLIATADEEPDGQEADGEPPA
jgi:hypothetical protein